MKRENHLCQSVRGSHPMLRGKVALGRLLGNFTSALENWAPPFQRGFILRSQSWWQHLPSKPELINAR